MRIRTGNEIAIPWCKHGILVVMSRPGSLVVKLPKLNFDLLILPNLEVIIEPAGMGSNAVTVTKILQLLMILELKLELSYT